MKTKTYYFLAVTILSAMFAVVPCFCQDDGSDTKAVYTVQGEITSLDTVAGTIVVKWMQSDQSIQYDEIVFKVPEGLQIRKGTDTVGVADINQFDRVVVQYRRTNPIGLPTVVNMTIAETD